LAVLSDSSLEMARLITKEQGLTRGICHLEKYLYTNGTSWHRITE